MVSFGNKSEFFAVLADLLPVHYFEKAPVVRIVWELWISIRTALAQRDSNSLGAHRPQMSNVSSSTGSLQATVVDSFLLKEISIEFN